MDQKVIMFFFDGKEYTFLCSTFASLDEENSALVVFNAEKLEMLYEVIKEQLAIARENGFVV